VTWEAIASSFLLVAASEMGDKSQLLAFSLAARFRRPWTVLAGILVAMLVNNGLAATVGVQVAARVSPRALSLVLAGMFTAFGIWTLRTKALDADAQKPSRFGPFATTVLLFFLAEMGDKTQLATVALAARHHAIVGVTLATTAGMLLADGLAVWLGDKLATRARARWVHVVAALLFFAFAAASAWDAAH
jgi:putative Ca2+/H+ antiporter (TMEM165/GDT1 family)